MMAVTTLPWLAGERNPNTENTNAELEAVYSWLPNLGASLF